MWTLIPRAGGRRGLCLVDKTWIQAEIPRLLKNLLLLLSLLLLLLLLLFLGWV